MTLGTEKYLLLTTFKRSGEAISTPVWCVPLDDGSVGFWTSSGSGKAKRLRHTARVTVQPCDARGRVKAGSTVIEGTARIVEGTELDVIRASVRAKYGFMTKITKVLNAIGGILKRKRTPYGDIGVVITPS
jgi:hypothetical protein